MIYIETTFNKLENYFDEQLIFASETANFFIRRDFHFLHF